MPKPDDFDLIPRNSQPGSRRAGQGGAQPGEPVYGESPHGAPPHASPAYSALAYDTPAYGPPGPGEPLAEAEPRRRSWAWLLTLGVVAFVAFAGGAALFTLRDRLGTGSATTAPLPNASPAAGTPGASGASELTPQGWLATQIALATLTPQTPVPGGNMPVPGGNTPDPAATAIALATVQARSSPSPGPSPSPTQGPAPTPTPCPIATAPNLAAIRQHTPLGCPTSDGRVVWAAYEPFERGGMLWRSDTNRSYLLTNDARWEVVNAAWDEQEPPGRGEPPPGLYAPQRGFGYAWGTQEAIFRRLGWATDIEKGFCAEVQEFAQGFLLQSIPVPSCTDENLYNQATAGDWRPVALAAHTAGLWSGTLGGAPIAPAAAAAPGNSTAAAPGNSTAAAPGGAPSEGRTVSVATRPEANGLFAFRSNAVLAQPIVVDGALNEWPAGGWQPIAALVQGGDRYTGPDDASGSFNIIWSTQGLMLGVSVIDDRWRPDPLGTDLWQGDGIELHMDTLLSNDYAAFSADNDDFQVGIAPTGNGGRLQVYRWLPLAIEGAQPAQGQAVAGPGGYTLEILLPWDLFLLDPPQAGASFGFNLSINDNDSDTPSQESLLSASPARTTYDNPTEWGTLVLLP